jgi:hypothetical protein
VTEAVDAATTAPFNATSIGRRRKLLRPWRLLPPPFALSHVLTPAPPLPSALCGAFGSSATEGRRRGTARAVLLPTATDWVTAVTDSSWLYGVRKMRGGVLPYVYEDALLSGAISMWRGPTVTKQPQTGPMHSSLAAACAHRGRRMKRVLDRRVAVTNAPSDSGRRRLGIASVRPRHLGLTPLENPDKWSLMQHPMAITEDILHSRQLCALGSPWDHGAGVPFRYLPGRAGLLPPLPALLQALLERAGPDPGPAAFTIDAAVSCLGFYEPLLQPPTSSTTNSGKRVARVAPLPVSAWACTRQAPRAFLSLLLALLENGKDQDGRSLRNHHLPQIRLRAACLFGHGAGAGPVSLVLRY